MSDKKKSAPKFTFNSFWIYIPILVILLGLSFFNSSNLGSRNISKNEFNKILLENDIEKIVVENNNVAQIFLKSDAEKKEAHKKITDSPLYRKGAPLYTYNFGDLQNFENEIKKEKAQNNLDFDRKNVEPTSLVTSIIEFLPFIILIGIWIFFMKRMSGGAGGGGGGGQIFNIGKSKAKLFDQDTKVKTTFKDVAGLEGAKEEIQEIVDFLKTPEKYTKLGGKIPKGALLVGPPGTGKTLLAKAVAGEAGVPFFSLSGSDFVEMFVGVGASRVRDLFKKAQEKSPSIIFIDEIDAIGRARGKNNMTGGNDERENTLNQLLTEMDGFGTDTNVIVLAATNRADVLDSALMRAGRFDRQIYVDLPDLHERREIFDVHIKPLKLAENTDLELLAQQTPGFSGADIANLCNEAALIAARNNKEAIEQQDFLDAVDRIVGGLEKKNKVITPKEKEVIAFHEAGHATVSWMLEHAAPLVKVTIVPRGQSLGAAWYLPEDRKIIQTEQMLDEMCATMGGRAAERLIFNKISTGALSDLEKVTKQARAMVTVYGLNEKVGNVTYYDSSGNDGFVKPYSDDTAKVIDEEISKIIEGQYQRAIDLLTKHEDKLSQLAALLLEKEVMFKVDLEKIFGERPFEKKEIKTTPVIEE
ncbi:ATP-dependent zinc metalloprotease FtsH [Tenacibaculum finnmarkense]|uniref:ATP-dependent zinc metalloprotease FtsH n=1 Tax=Tenacibaculum finnmarkense genomovar finnmarkense TaxID=1458503 RepID=A0AAP1RDU8_9FLAO|nr:ATP-dependent zinc metalloprotease FtsH [Tenacibaculum finnmarkense]MBE7652344.1 ATP-dependent zinc metalloprotease FtsH [Tenacibaculum finnmarkense genomovar finnmarkense]MBE7694484.1 ATP-dependent zinc metalloprotease FtsH [Tenacibaculum finnmarkense genomovar finnmarkense]MCD8426671.1 ATP-dependent zinc metalloprotease FtsH [Tenacibaculum finnmarkense genomovar finnmarkense]MCD8440305.1 ATP-dependent zinc metalloprotease FtsH [Tenacibaculum finnmarkense genomovar ulcerans]MCG8186087.1 AT